MREIKFRIWDNVNYMSSPFTLQYVQSGKIQFTDDVKIMQYTGLKDKNGKEIYEGDILSFPSFEEGTGKIVVKDAMRDWSHINNLHNLEIIGNVYESLELLSASDNK
jgi:hypothetical protein